MKKTVQDRIRKLNPEVIIEGSLIRGIHRKPTSWRRAKRRMIKGERVYNFYLKGGKKIWYTLLQGEYPCVYNSYSHK